jgi:hypothetical protein
LYRNGQTVNVNSGIPYGISDSGIIAGQNSGSGFMWKNNKTVNLFSGTATAVNNSGTVVGNGGYAYFNGQGWNQVGGLCYQNGTVTSLFDTRTGRQPGSSSSALAYAINNNGTVVGSIGGGTYNPYGLSLKAVAWFGTASSPIDLGAGDGSRAIAVSSDNRIIGNNGISSGSWLWQDGSLQWLGEPSKGAGFYAESVNAQGQILGVSYGISGNGGKGALELWQNGVFTDLNTLFANGSDYRFYNNEVINDSGQIAAIASIDGRSAEALLISSVPEPSTWLAGCLLVPFLLVEIYRRREVQ